MHVMRGKIVRLLSTGSANRVSSDIVIVGGGIVGAALACKVAGDPIFANTSVRLLEVKAPHSLEHVSASKEKDIRVYALTPASVNLLKDIKVWSKVASISDPIEKRVSM